MRRPEPRRPVSAPTIGVSKGDVGAGDDPGRVSRDTRLDFTVVRDDRNGDERWIEVKPPSQDLLLVLSRRGPGETRRSVPDRLPHSDLFFDCADIESTYAELIARGVRFPLPPARQHFGWWALFEDHEGTRYALGQWEGETS